MDPASGSVSPRTASTPKNVAFELLFPDSPNYRARLPLRVNIYPHDTTDSIVTTVKNFYGLYPGPGICKGVSFEDERATTLIARYENFRNNMVVYVRVIDEITPVPSAFAPRALGPPEAPQSYSADANVVPSHQPPAHLSRPPSRASRRRSLSPNGRGRRSESIGAGSKIGRSRSSKNRGDGDSFNGYSSGDGASGSVSGKTKESLGTTDISVENIVEGGRRKRAKFESSELPLFAPPQMPAATSNASVSPARRVDPHRHSLPFVQPGQNPFVNPRPLHSPQNYNSGYGYIGTYTTPTAEDRRGRASMGYPPSARVGPGMGMMPTPDPTVGSCMSEEDKDVAMQLMRLGDMSNVSHGRTSASTLDDTFSGIADATSSTGATSDADSDDDAPPARRQKLVDMTGNHRRILPTTENHAMVPHESVEASDDDTAHDNAPAPLGSMAAPKLKMPKPRIHTTPSNASGNAASKPRPLQSLSTLPASKAKIPSKAPKTSKSKKPASATGPMSPASLPASSRKASVASNGALVPGEDDQPDLSTKPRCQRCRKSKKGCDRQRPCGRCRDAGLSADQCISEDEGNGRKGRYGRHMGVPIQKDALPAPPALLPAAPIAASANPGGNSGTGFSAGVSAFTSTALVSSASALDKNKKRKR